VLYNQKIFFYFFLLLLGLTVNYSYAEILFEDDFERADNLIIGNGWSEYDEDIDSWSEIKSGIVEFTSKNNLKSPCLYHTFTESVEDNLVWGIDYDGDEQNDGAYFVRIDLGDGLTCDTPEQGGVISHRLTHASKNAEPLKNWLWTGESKYNSSFVDLIAEVNGFVNISVIMDKIDGTFDVGISGAGFTQGNSTLYNLSWKDDVSIDSFRITLQKVNTNNFNSMNIDNFYVGQTSDSCGLVVNSVLDFGSLESATISSEVRLDLTNFGINSTSIDVYGKDWKLISDNSVIIAGENTRFSTASGTFDSKTALNNTDGTKFVTSIDPGMTQSTFWNVNTALIEPGFAGGDVQQEMTFVSTC